MLTPGPKRIILISAGRYDYAEVVLGQSVHLVGPNNAGKTSLIATLQMLYVASFNEMSFSRPWDESRRYYFRLDTSTILFEIVTSDGRFVTVGLRGRGQLGAYQVDRFAFEGSYRKEDFIDEDNRVRPFTDVKKRLVAERYFKDMEPGDIRAALVNELSIPQLNMGIVPLRDVGRYSDFVYLFKNLLRLNDLSQKDIKETFLTVYRHGIKNAIEVDLNREYSDAYSALMAEKSKLASLRQVALIAIRLKAEYEKRVRACRNLPALYAAVSGAKARQIVELTDGEAKDQDHLRGLQRQEEEADESYKQLNEQNEKIVEAGLVLKQWFDGFEQDATTLKDYLPEIEDARRSNLKTAIDTLIASMVNAGSPSEIEARLGRTSQKLKLTVARRDNHACLLGTQLQDRLGQVAMGDLGRIFHPELLRLTVEEDGVIVSDEDALTAMLRRLHGKVANGRLILDSISIPLDQVASREAVGVADLAVLNEEIQELEREVAKLENELDIAKNMAVLQVKRKGLEKELEDSDELRKCYVRHSDNIRIHPLKRTADSEQKKQKEDNDASRKKHSDQRIARGRLKTAIEGAIKAKKDRLRVLDNLRFIPPNPLWPMGAVDPEWPEDAMELNSLYSRTYSEYSNAQEEVRRILNEAEILNADGFAGTTEDEKIDAVIEAVDSLSERERAYGEHLSNVIKGMRATFQRMFEAMDSLRESADRFSRTIGNVSISNLRGLSVKIVENTEITRHYRSVTDAGAANLFADLAETEEAINEIIKTIQRAPTLRLADWFGVQFLVKTADGAETVYNDLSKIESNGTTMSIKSLVNIVLIQAMMRDRRSFILPFYIDEANQIDEANLREIVALANKKGFCPIFASTVPVAAAESLYMVRMTPDSRAIIDPKSRIMRKAKSAAHDEAA